MFFDLNNDTSVNTKQPLNEAFAYVRHVCYIRTEHFKPQARNPQSGLVQRWFDLSAEDIPTYPPIINDHLAGFNEAILSDTLKLWTLSLAKKVQMFLLNPDFSLKQEIKEMIGSEKVNTYNALSRNNLITNMSNSLCHAYFHMILQHLYKIEPFKTDILKKAREYEVKINYQSNLDKLCIDEIKRNLFLNSLDEEHLSFWDSHTGLLFGIPTGQAIYLNGKTYHMPKRVNAMMFISDSLSYEDYLQEIELARKTPILFSNPFSMVQRYPETEQLYESKTIERYKVA